MTPQSTGITLALLLACVGCDPLSVATAGAEGIKVIRGAQAHVIPIKDISAQTAYAYSRGSVGTVTTDVPPICTPECMAEVRHAIAEVCASRIPEKLAGGGDQ